jgi:hypothetical protein
MTEDFSTYTKVDPNSRFFVDKHQINFTGLPASEAAYLYKDYGANYFSGNFSFNVDVTVAASIASTVVAVWGLANVLGSVDSLRLSSADEQALIFYQSGSTLTLNLEETVGGTPHDVTYNITLNRPYYLTIRRDTSVGTYGTLYCDIYSDAARTTLLTTLTRTLTASKSFRYAYAIQSYSTGTSGYPGTGSVGNLSSLATTGGTSGISRSRQVMG